MQSLRSNLRRRRLCNQNRIYGGPLKVAVLWSALVCTSSGKVKKHTGKENPIGLSVASGAVSAAVRLKSWMRPASSCVWFAPLKMWAWEMLSPFMIWLWIKAALNRKYNARYATFAYLIYFITLFITGCKDKANF